MKWRNRIIGSGKEDPQKILSNPYNFRKHPEEQEKALQRIFEKIGWVQEVIINKRTGHLLDGHLRVKLAAKNKEKEIPVKYVDIDEQEERMILAAYDQITYMADTDADVIVELLEKIEEDGNLNDLLILLNNTRGVEEFLKQEQNEINFKTTSEEILDEENPHYMKDEAWQKMGMPEYKQEDKMGVKTLYVHFRTWEDVQAFAELVGQEIKETTKFIWYPKEEKAKLINYSASL